jgi:hypothetical protein
MQKSVAPSASLNVQLNLSLNDMEYITDTVIKVKQSYVLGLPYGGPRYKTGQLVLQDNIPSYLKRNRAFNRAIFEALTAYPDADYVMPASYKLEKHMMFLGREEELTLKLKILKIPSKK